MAVLLVIEGFQRNGTNDVYRFPDFHEHGQRRGHVIFAIGLVLAIPGLVATTGVGVNLERVDLSFDGDTVYLNTRKRVVFRRLARCLTPLNRIKRARSNASRAGER